MSVFISTGSGLDSIDAAVTTGFSPTEVVSADITCKMPPALSPTATFKQHSISLDSTGQILRLRQDTQLHLNLETREFDVAGWGIRMPLSDVGNLPREMARQYLRLWSNSERNQLRGDEREELQRGKHGRAFDMVNIGELFSAYVKLDGAGKIREVENVTVLGNAEELLHEVDDDWIQKA